MALRESSRAAGEAADLALVTGTAAGDGNVAHGAYLTTLAEAVALWRWDDVDALRTVGAKRMSANELRDAILVAAGFNGITRIADAIGIRLDTRTEQASTTLRAETGIDGFAPERKWAAV